MTAIHLCTGITADLTGAVDADSLAVGTAEVGPSAEEIAGGHLTEGTKEACAGLAGAEHPVPGPELSADSATVAMPAASRLAGCPACVADLAAVAACTAAVACTVAVGTAEMLHRQ
jgi:hypothetical protein